MKARPRLHVGRQKDGWTSQRELALTRSARSDVRPSPTSDKHRTKGQRRRETPYGAYLRAVAIIQNQCFVRCPKMRELASGRRAPTIALPRERLYKTPDFVRRRLVIAKARRVSAVRGLSFVASRTATASSPSRTATLLRCSSARGHSEQPTTSLSPHISA